MDDPGFRPTHVAPLEGLPTWSAPDPAQPAQWLDPLLPVRVVAREGDWARVLCANGWTAWVDGRLLVALPDGPPGTPHPLTPVGDPRQLLARLEAGLAAYRGLVERLLDGRIDAETFRRSTASCRLGAVIDGERAWLLDLDRGRWYFCEGTQLQPYATVEEPAEDAVPPATQAIRRDGRG
jgi:hypothetical protein